VTVRRGRWRWARFIVIACAAGCASISGTLPAPAPPVPPGVFQAGAAKVDLTPMPGYPMGGFSAGGKIARGVWTRLHARAVAFEDEDGNGLALASCDLWGFPAGLADRVAELVATTYGAPRLGREQIVVAATHTHHSPGNFASSPLYNIFTSPKAGFDRDLFEFLAHRIAYAVSAAWKERRPAVLVRNELALSGIARNRSLGAFLRNGEAAAELLAENTALPTVPTPFPAGGEQAYLAIDPTLTVIRAEPHGGGGPPLAVMAFYALHPTAMGPATEVYNSDVFGIAATLVERELEGTPVAVFNGAEGDVSSNWMHQDRHSALALGAVLADGIRTLLDSAGTDATGRIGYRFTRCRMDDLAPPFTGASQLQGSEGDWTFFRDAGWREGLTEDDPERQVEGHGPKKYPFADELLHRHVALDLPFLLDKLADVPEEVPLGVYRIGAVTLATLPGEFTTMLGRRIARSVAEAAGTGERTLLVGLANEYLSYFTTEEEYKAQHYEGASVVYGPGSARRIENVLRRLAQELPEGTRRTEPLRFQYGAGPKKSFGVKEFDFLRHSDRYEVTYVSLANVLMDEERGIPAPDHPFVVWVDASPRWTGPSRTGAPVTPRVRVEVSLGGAWQPLVVDGAPATDDGVDFVTTVVGSFQGECRWISIWMVPDGSVDEAATFRFVVDGTSGRIFRSAAFTLPETRARFGAVGFAKR